MRGCACHTWNVSVMRRAGRKLARRERGKRGLGGGAWIPTTHYYCYTILAFNLLDSVCIGLLLLLRTKALLLLLL